ncbi:MAG: thiamine pyrophosphate-dependent enzyme [Acidobacteriota bacterium]|nr:thiamine pyrophosphate-dependent enzyme [Acidobacteriota bacterium]
MSDASGDATSALPRELLVDLHGFLSLEAPFLLRDLPPRVSSEEELESVLLGRIEARFQTGPEYSEERLFPLVSHRRAVSWGRDDLTELVKGFFARRTIRSSLTAGERREMLRTMLLTRAVDGFLKRAFDAGDIRWGDHPSPQKGFRSTGQEAIVGAALRLRRGTAYGQDDSYRGDVIGPLIRDLGALLMFMPDPTHPILVQYGKSGTPVAGRDLHTGDFGRGVLPAAAPLAISVQTLIGVAYAFKQRRESRVCVAFTGDGGVSLGEWHEAIGFAAAQRLNVVFVIENNQWALGTHVSEQTAARRFAVKAKGYGIPGVTLFGNDPDEVAAGVGWAAERARSGAGPALVELVTYRRSGHAHHDDDRFHGSEEPKIPGYELEVERRAWERVDPIDLYRRRLAEEGVVTPGEAEEMDGEVRAEVEEAGRMAAQAPWPEPADYRSRVYAPRSTPAPDAPAESQMKMMAYDEAVRDGLAAAMEGDERVFVLGEDVGGRYGGAFGVTRGLAKRFGDARCLNTPLAESAIVGCAVGAAIAGMRPVVEMQFADFLAPAFNALVNNAAKVHWRWGRPVPLVVRLPYGGATGSPERLLGGGPFHSQCPESWFLHTPGWKVVAPATPRDAKGLLLASIRDDNPVAFLEAKGLYGFFRTDLREDVPVGGDFEVPLGSAAVRRAGVDLTIITYGAMVWTSLRAADSLAAKGIETEVVDLRTLWPLDEETISSSVRKTHRVLVVHEATGRGGFGGEIAARISDQLFYFLDAPVRRITAPDTPVPYSPPLEQHYLPDDGQLIAAATALLSE